MKRRIKLKGGWSLVRCEDETSDHFRDWFLENPDRIWVAKFWDGEHAGEKDAKSFAKAMKE